MCGENEVSARRRSARGYATARFVISPHTGRLTSVSGVPKPGLGVPFVRWRAAIRGIVTEPDANSHRLASSVVTGQDAAEVEERADALLRQVRLHVEPISENGPGQVRPASTSAIAPELSRTASALASRWRSRRIAPRFRASYTRARLTAAGAWSRAP